MKRFARLLCFLLIGSFLLASLAACNVQAPSTEDPAIDADPETNEPEDNGPEAEPDPDLSFDLKKYSIVYPNDANSATSAAASLLQQLLRAKGLMLDAGRDSYQGESNEGVYEILVGGTNRAVSAEALKAVESENGFVVHFFKNQIVLNANDDLGLEEAVRYFVKTYVFEAKQYEVDAKVGDSIAFAKRQLSLGGVMNYSLVVSSSASTEVQDAVKTLQTKLKKVSSMTTSIVNDQSYDKSKTNIVIGKTAYPESAAIRGGLKINQGGIGIKDNQIVIGGHHDKTVILALEKFVELLDRAKTTGGVMTMYVPLRSSYDYSAWLGDIPDFARGVYEGVYECGYDNLQLRYVQVEVPYIDEYVTEMKAYGYAVKEDNTIGENRTITMLGKQGLVNISYLKHDNSISIITDPLTTTSYKDTNPSYEKVTENTFAVSTLLYTHREVTDGNGMGYVMTLEDGRYIIYDGGYADQTTGESQADFLYEFLEENYKRMDRKIEIAAWIFSHSHGDHYGAFKSFTTKYANMVNVEYFVYNAPSSSVYSSFDTFLEKTVLSYVPQYYPNAKILKPHTGQILKFCNVDIEVLYTHEDFGYGKISLLNDSSLVLRVNMNGKSILLTGDAETGGSGVLCKMYGSYLKSDVLQINHHGYSGGTVELYDYANPTYTMWPTSQAAFDLRTTGEKYQWVSQQAVTSNRHIFVKVGKDKCLVADGAVEILHFNKDGTITLTTYTHGR